MDSFKSNYYISIIFLSCTSILRVIIYLIRLFLVRKYAKLPKCSKMLAVPNHVIGCECIHSASTTEYYR